MSIISAKTGVNLFHYHLIGTNIILTYNLSKSFLYTVNQETGQVLTVKPFISNLGYEQFINISKEVYLKTVEASN